MKIKITLIAFFASALILTSCMKNEVSPGIEAVRTAYAALLTAKAQAEITMANANAAYRNAEAQVQLAIAKIRLAEADSLTEEANRLREELAFDMQKWALELDSIAAQMDLEIAKLRKQIQDSANATVLAYWAKYLDALDALHTAQVAISNKLEAIAIQQLDLATGKTTAIDNATDAVAAAEAALAALQAELAEAIANLGNVDAIAERLAELHADTLAKHAQRLLLLAQASEIKHDADTEAAAVTSALAKKTASAALTAAAKTAVTNAKADLANADALFAAANPVPEFWQTAIDSVNDALDSLNGVYADTAADCLRARTAQDTLDLGISDLLARQELAQDTIDMYQDSIDAYGADTLAAWNDYKDAVAQWKTDTTTAGVLDRAIDVLADSLADQRGRLDPLSGQDSIDLAQLIALNAADSTIKYYAWFILTNQTLVLDVADTLLTYNDFGDAWDIYDEKVYDDPDFDQLIEDQQDIWDNIEDVLIPARETRLEYIAYMIEDWVTECLHIKSYIEEVLAFYEDAVAYKESRRPEYETYMNEFWYAFLDSLQGVVDAKLAALATANTNYTGATATHTAAVAAFTLANKPYADLIAAAAALQAEINILEEILLAYGNAGDYNDGVVGAFNAAIVTAKAAIVTAKNNLAIAVAAYAAGEVDLEQLEINLEELMAQLDAAQAQVDYWKALLEEAIAAGN